MELRFWASTDTGRTRDHNEDNFLVDKRLNLFVVCDGMGGHAAGEVASAVAVRTVREVISNNRAVIDRHTDSPHDHRSRRDVLKLLEYSVQEACTRIFDMAQANPDRRGMGTTCSLMLLIDRRSFIAHVGDSRIYLVRKGQVHQLTEDHSLINEMKRRGDLTEGEEFAAPYKNAITRAVGVYESVEVDTLDFDNLPEDRFLLCSDGLSMYLDDEHLAKFVGAEVDEATPKEAMRPISEGLIRFANARGGKDNITAVVVEVGESPHEDGDDVRLTMDTIRLIPLFHYLNYKELVRIINVTHRRTVKAAEVVVTQGETGEELHVILRGDFVVETNGKEVARLGPGRHFGEMALIDDRPRSATVRAAENGVLLTIRRPEFYGLLRKDPTMAVKLLWNFIQTLSSRLREAPASLAIPLASLSEGHLPPLPAKAQMWTEAPEAQTFDEGEPASTRSPGISDRAIAEDVTLPNVTLSQQQRDALRRGHFSALEANSLANSGLADTGSIPTRKRSDEPETE